MAKELILTQDENGCITPTSHKLNKDGYFRKNIGDGIFVMYHRYIWEQKFGKIPDGYEINHKCKNRACCNTGHLECIDGKEHAILTNTERYKERKDYAFRYWSSTGCTGTELARIYEVTTSAACRWIRSWKVWRLS